MQLKASLDSQYTRPLIGLILASLFLGLFLALPLGHQLVHPGEACSKTCPVHLLESSLLLLAVGVGSLFVLSVSIQGRPLARRSVSLPLFYARFFYRKRPPPNS